VIPNSVEEVEWGFVDDVVKLVVLCCSEREYSSPERGTAVISGGVPVAGTPALSFR